MDGYYAALASTWKLTINPHTSMTGLNMAASIHLLAAIDNAGYFEADVSKAKRILGYEATTSLDDMLDIVIPWVRQQVEYGNI